MSALVLRALTTGDADAFARAVAAWPAGEVMRFAPIYEAHRPFADYVALLEAHARGENLPDGWVPSITHFGFVDTDIVGRLQLRLHLNAFLLKIGGNIGYVVLPQHRRRGYATAMLQQGMRLARDRGFDRLLVTCDDDNLASVRTIERSGGRLEDAVFAGEGVPPKRRYWIRLL